MFVYMSVTPEVASELRHSAPGCEAAQEIVNIAGEYGLKVEQLHPGVEDPLMARSFFIDVQDTVIAQEVITRLKSVEGVEAAYLTPAGEPPGESPGGAPY